MAAPKKVQQKLKRKVKTKNFTERKMKHVQILNTFKWDKL